MTAFSEVAAAYVPATTEVELTEGISVTVQELSGADRFEVAERAEGPQWPLMKWIAFTGLVGDSKPDNVDDLDELAPEWVLKIAKAVTNLSGIDEDEIEAAGEEFAGGSDIGGS